MASSSQDRREATVYAEMQIAAILTAAAIISNQQNDAVIDRYKTMLQSLRVRGTQ